MSIPNTNIAMDNPRTHHDDGTGSIAIRTRGEITPSIKNSEKARITDLRFDGLSSRSISCRCSSDALFISSSRDLRVFRAVESVNNWIRVMRCRNERAERDWRCHKSLEETLTGGRVAPSLLNDSPRDSLLNIS